MPVTIKDIARRIGKSTTTVSRALNDFSDVAPETKALVRSVAAEMGYFPNTLAQRLQKRQSDTIGLIIPSSGPRYSDPFFSEFIAGIGNTAAPLGYDLLVATRAPGDAELATYRSSMDTHRVDGFIVVRTRLHDARIDCLRARAFPFVAFGRVAGPIDFPYVDEDSAVGMAAVARHLYGLGHRQIACIAPPEPLMFAHHRVKGLRDAWRGLGGGPESLTIIEGDLTQQGGYRQASRLLDWKPRPTAIVACNDLMALGAMRAAQERGLVVGRDLSVTGFDNIPPAEYAHPPLTTVNQPIYQIAVSLTEMLVRRLRRESSDVEQVLLTPDLIVRDSTGPTPSN